MISPTTSSRARSARTALLALAATAALSLVGCTAAPGTSARDGLTTSTTPPSPAASASSNADEDAAASPATGADTGADAPSTGPAAPTFEWFRVTPESVVCSSADGTVPVLIEWMSSDASEAWVGIDTEDARAEPFTAVAPVGTYLRDFFCDRDEMTFTVSIANSDGTTHASAVVVRTGP